MPKDSNQFTNKLFQGLRALAESSFPKKCANCGRVFETAEQFLAETESLQDARTGLKAAVEEDGSTIVEAFRNCPCGSTLMEFFGDRRDSSERGILRRKRFGELLEFLVNHGLEYETARAELLKVVRGEISEVLKNFSPSERMKG